MTGSRVVVIGSMNADLTVRTPRLPRPGETVTGSELEVRPGGKSANQAAVVARLGARVSLLACVGEDAHGELLITEADRVGVDTCRIRRLEAVATGTAMIAVDDEAENFIIISPGANARLTPELMAEEADLLDEAAVLCLCLEIDPGTVLAAAQAAGRRGVPVVLNLSPSAEVDPALLTATDVLLVNEHELADLIGARDDGADWAEARDELATRGIPRAVVTLGARGALVMEPDQITEIATPKVAAVDTTGAGDAFTGSLAHRLAEGDDLVTAARFAARVAAFSTTSEGAQSSYPDRDQLTSFAG